MGKNISKAGWLFGLGLVLGACSGSSKTTPGGGQTDACSEGARICEGLNVKVCGADGKQTVAETCMPPQSCAEGACVNTACVPNTRFCKDGHVFRCDSQGAGSTLDETCSTSEFCLEEDGDAECSDTACTANEPMCDDTIATVCKPDGSGPKPGGQDCGAGDQVCYQGTCRASAKLERRAWPSICPHVDAVDVLRTICRPAAHPRATPHGLIGARPHHERLITGLPAPSPNSTLDNPQEHRSERPRSRSGS